MDTDDDLDEEEVQSTLINSKIRLKQTLKR